MSDQQVETSIETSYEADAEGNIKPQSMEDKFFGVKTQITKEDSKDSDDLDVEVVSDVPEEDRRAPKQETKDEPVDSDVIDKEIADTSKRAGDRINQIKYEYHEERRAKEAAKRESSEAVNRLKAVMAENQRLSELVNTGGQALNQHAVANAQFAKVSAQEKFKKAYDDGDADAMALAQEELSKATLAEQQAPGYARAMQAQAAQAAQAAQVQPQIPEPDPAMKAWAGKNPWFMGSEPVHREMTSFAMYVDQKLQAEGVDPVGQAEQYYGKVDEAMKEQFPSFFGVPQQAEAGGEVQIEEEKRQPSNVVAPATRNSGANKNPRNVRLTQTQVKLARSLGITPAQYAKQLLKET
tara:strand:+ start:3430 stop:4488 length:1059 start_codon:yes stop_codon:yes gene_type:complete